MALLDLSRDEYKQLEKLAVETKDAKVLRRAEALLWLHDGLPVDEIATRLRISTRTIYNWVNRYQERDGYDTLDRLSDGKRVGRPRTVRGVIDPIIQTAIQKSPDEIGYEGSRWTAPLLQQYLNDKHKIKVSRQSIIGALRRQGFRWKSGSRNASDSSQHWQKLKNISGKSGYKYS